MHFLQFVYPSLGFASFSDGKLWKIKYTRMNVSRRSVGRCAGRKSNSRHCKCGENSIFYNFVQRMISNEACARFGISVVALWRMFAVFGMSAYCRTWCHTHKRLNCAPEYNLCDYYCQPFLWNVFDYILWRSKLAAKRALDRPTDRPTTLLTHFTKRINTDSHAQISSWLMYFFIFCNVFFVRSLVSYSFCVDWMWFSVSLENICRIFNFFSPSLSLFFLSLYFCCVYREFHQFKCIVCMSAQYRGAQKMRRIISFLSHIFGMFKSLCYFASLDKEETEWTEQNTHKKKGK